MRVGRVALIGMTVMMVGEMRPWSHVVDGQAEPCLVATLQGDVRGIDRGRSCEFRAVPYGASTGGGRRWAPPVPAAPWAPVTLDATVANPPVCPQINPAGLTIGTEDCLRLHIWAPHRSSAPPRPVIVWLHPGSFVGASAGIAPQNGTRFVEEVDAVVVTPNYRLGPFGFLGHGALRTEGPEYPSAGNYGLLDQRLAFEWVRTHISAFGGDPSRITIAGQSAGGLSVILTVTLIGAAFCIAVTQRATNSGSAIRQAPKRPDDTRSLGQPTLRLISS